MKINSFFSCHLQIDVIYFINFKEIKKGDIICEISQRLLKGFHLYALGDNNYALSLDGLGKQKLPEAVISNRQKRISGSFSPPRWWEMFLTYFKKRRYASWIDATFS